MADGRGIDDE